MVRERNRWLCVYALIVYAFLFAPIVVLIIYSFNKARRGLVWQGFTFDWYPRLFANDELLDALIVTLEVALVAVIVSTVLGSLLGLGLARIRFRGRGATETLLLVPMITPEIVMGLSLLLFFLQLFDAHGSVAQLWVAHITFCVSYVAVVVRARAASMDPRLEEAARDLGASAWGAFRYVTLPLIAPAVLAGAPPRLLAQLRRLRRHDVQQRCRQLDAAALHLRQHQVRRDPGDQRDLDDHRRHHGDRDPHRLARGGVRHGVASARHRGRARGLARIPTGRLLTRSSSSA